MKLPDSAASSRPVSRVRGARPWVVVVCTSAAVLTMAVMVVVFVWVIVPMVYAQLYLSGFPFVH